MFGLFRSKPLFDEGSTQWFFDTYAWALRHFGSDIFRDDSMLITPTDRFFPDRGGSAEEKAVAALGRVRSYAGMEGWPCELHGLAPGMAPPPAPAVGIGAVPRGPRAAVSVAGDRGIPVAFDPALVRNPQALIAVLAQQLAFHLAHAAREASPGGDELFGPTTDLLAVFMGFGLFLANSALTVCRSGCSGCAVGVQALGYLTEEEFAYALAIFCVLKNIPAGEVEPHLKKTLRPVYRRAVKEITTSRAGEIRRLGEFDHPLKAPAGG